MTLASKTRDWMTPKEVAVELQVTPRAVVNWICKKKLDSVKVGGRYRITQDAVADFLDNRN
jgi:excisionase family DNA binding protein